MSFWQILNTVFSIFVSAVFFYQIFYILIGLFFKKKFKDVDKQSTYGILIAGRNEELVIKQLIDSIKKQNYDTEKLKIFVVADNCSENDKTAEYARELGAVVYERHDKNKIGKSYALNFLLSNISKDFPDYCPDGWFVFDADNILDKNYIKEMNKAFNNGHKIVTSYRSSKNYGDTLWSMGSSVHFVRECRFVHTPRTIFNLSTHVSGTGFLVSNEILNPKKGWNYNSITEDWEFSCDNIKKGQKIVYCDDAVFYDEQPKSWRQTYRQRLRWQKGLYQVAWFFSFSFLGKFLSSLKFTFYDFLVYFSPLPILSTTWAITNGLVSFVNSIINIFSGYPIFSEISHMLISLLVCVSLLYLSFFAYGSLAVIKDWKRIKASNKQKILSMFAYPLFMISLIPITFIALFKKVEWTPIKHDVSKSVDEISS